MAASMIRTCFVRLVSPRHYIAGVSTVNVGKASWPFQEPASEQHISRQFTDQSYGSVIKIPRRHIAEKVLTDSDALVHNRICGMLLGKKRKELKKFIYKSGIRFNVHTTDGDHVLVSGINAEVVKKAVEIVTPHINKIKQEIENDFMEKVLTDDDEEMHHKICGMLIGKGGENINRMRSETGLELKIIMSEIGVIVRGTTDAEVKSAVEKVTQEIERIRNTIEVSD